MWALYMHCTLHASAAFLQMQQYSQHSRCWLIETQLDMPIGVHMQDVVTERDLGTTLLYAMGGIYNSGSASHSVKQCPVLRRCILCTYVYQFNAVNGALTMLGRMDTAWQMAPPLQGVVVCLTLCACFEC
jgi:hypothetical protein